MQFERKTVFMLLGVLAVAAILLAVVLWPSGTDKWEAMTNRIDRLHVETRSRKLPRSELRAKLVRGNAWDEYDIALSDSYTWRDDQNGALFARFVQGDPQVERTEVEALVASHANALEHLRLGTQRSDGQYLYQWERGSEMELPGILGSRRLANVAVAQARIWADNGRPQDAVDLLLDTTVFGRDLATNSPLLSGLIGFEVYSKAFDELRHLVLSGQLTQKQLADLAAKLDVVDRDFPTVGSMVSNETLLFGISVLNESRGSSTSSGWLSLKDGLKRGDWRFVIAPRATLLDAVETQESYLQRSAKFDQIDYAAAKKEAEAIAADAIASKNALVRMTVPNMIRSLEGHRETVAHLRLLKAGATFLATGQMPTLTDPFGSNLLFRQEAGKFTIWSIGGDGSDQNGVGAWERRAPGDIVFEIRK